jgi:hypothetical protein
MSIGTSFQWPYFSYKMARKLENYNLIKPPPTRQKRSHLATELTSSVANSLQYFSASPEEKFGR